jgi:hypothetical protein
MGGGGFVARRFWSSVPCGAGPPRRCRSRARARVAARSRQPVQRRRRRLDGSETRPSRSCSTSFSVLLLGRGRIAPILPSISDLALTPARAGSPRPPSRTTFCDAVPHGTLRLEPAKGVTHRTWLARGRNTTTARVAPSSGLVSSTSRSPHRPATGRRRRSLPAALCRGPRSSSQPTSTAVRRRIAYEYMMRAHVLSMLLASRATIAADCEFEKNVDYSSGSQCVWRPRG